MTRFAPGLASETRFISWGVGIEDLDNDGNPDIFWVTGGIYPELQGRPDQPYAGPRIVFRNLGNGRFEELMRRSWAGHRSAALQPRLRLRRFRQRRRYGHPDRQSERAAFAAAQRCHRRPSLDQGETDRHKIEPQRHRRASHRPLWRQDRRCAKC